MKLHDLRPAEGAHRPRTRVGRGIAAGKGKTAGRGTKGQKARAGGSIAPWFEGGQTPLHVRIPKLRGFRNPFKVDHEVVNVGRIAALIEAGRLEPTGAPSGKGKKATPAPITVNQEILRAVGAVRSLDKPLKILGGGEIDVPVFVVADAFTASARSKIEAAGGSVQVLELPTGPLAALGVEQAEPPATPPAKAKAKAAPRSRASVAADEAAEAGSVVPDVAADATTEAGVAEGTASDEPADAGTAD
jgi:large subunit ribosomal protein L15